MNLLHVVVLAMLSFSPNGCNVTKHFVTLNWTPSTTANVEYIVYRAPAGSTNFVRLNPAYVVGKTFTDTSVTAGARYSYEVTAFDGTTESKPSNLFTTSVPSP